MVSSIDPKEESWNQLQRQFVFLFLDLINKVITRDLLALIFYFMNIF